jgi:hypothetical protein
MHLPASSISGKERELLLEPKTNPVKRKIFLAKTEP